MNAGTISEIRDFRRALRHMERFISGTLRDKSGCCGVTVTQCHVLLKIEEEGEISLIKLRKYLGLDKSTLSRTIDVLVRNSLLMRNEAPEDRRYSRVRLTEAGMRFLVRLNDECDNYYGPIYDALSPTIRERIIDDFSALLDATSRIRFGGTGVCSCVLEEAKDE